MSSTKRYADCRLCHLPCQASGIRNLLYNRLPFVAVLIYDRFNLRPLITHKEATMQMQAIEETHEDNRGAYRIAEMPGGVDIEVERLRQQALLAWSEEARQLKWFGLRDGMSILDVGSGPGFVSAQLLDMLPNSTVTGIELDPVMIE